MFGHGGVDLHAEADIVGPVQDIHGALPGAFDLAKIVVDRRPGRVQAEGDAADARVPGLFQARFGGQRGGGGGQRAAQALFGGVGDEIEEVPAHHGVAAGEDEDGMVAEGGQAVDEAEAFLSGKFQRMGMMLGVGAAVDARVGAGPGHFPGDGEGRFVEVRVHHAAVVVGAFGGGGLGEVWHGRIKNED